MRAKDEHEAMRSRQGISQDISRIVMRHREMPQHFVELEERVKKVWNLLQVPDVIVVALVGMGGIGREDIFL